MGMKSDLCGKVLMNNDPFVHRGGIYRDLEEALVLMIDGEFDPGILNLVRYVQMKISQMDCGIAYRTLDLQPRLTLLKSVAGSTDGPLNNFRYSHRFYKYIGRY